MNSIAIAMVSSLLVTRSNFILAFEIGVGEQLLGRWVRLARAADDAGNTGAVLDADERAELERLRRENAELRLDREFLKIAAFFVSEQNR